MFEAYSVAVRVSLVNNVTAGLMGISSAFARVSGDANKLKGELNAIRLTMLTGGAIAGVGFFGLNAISKTLGPAKEYAHQLALMNTAGMKQAEIVRSINAAWALNKTVPTSTSAQNLAAIQNFRATLGSTDEAINFLPMGQKLAYILANQKGLKNTATLEGQQGEASAFARALDIRNATTDPARLAREGELMLKAIVGSGGQLGATDFNTVFRTSRATGKAWSSEFAYQILPSLIQELKTGGGSGAGGGPAAGLVSAAQAVVGGKLTNVALAEYMRLGLVDQSKIIRTSTGNVKGIDKGGIVGSDLFQSNPYAWAQTVLKPAMIRNGIDTEKEMRASLGQLFRVRTAEGVMSTMLLETRQIERDKRMFGIARGMDAYTSLAKNDPNYADAALAAQWKNLLTVIGYEILPVVVSGTLRLVDGLRGLTATMREHPRLTKALVIGFGALSAAMAFGGTVLLLNGAIRGLGLAFRLFGVAAQLPAMTRGIFGLASSFRALATAEMTIMGTSGPAAAALTGLGTAIVGFVSTLALVVLPAAAAILLAKREHDQDAAILADPSAASGMSKAVLRKKLESEAKFRRFWGIGGAAGYQNKADTLSSGGTLRGGGRAPEVSPFVPFYAQGQGGQAPINVFMDGRRVADIVSGHQARQLGASRVTSGRHDARVTPAAKTGVPNR